jgi:hypothetical protein
VSPDAARPSQNLSPELRISQPSTNTLLNEGAFELRHCADNLKHQPAGRRGEIEIVTEADKSNAIAVEVGEGVNEVL